MAATRGLKAKASAWSVTLRHAWKVVRCTFAQSAPCASLQSIPITGLSKRAHVVALTRGDEHPRRDVLVHVGADASSVEGFKAQI